jgi:hypothetical protein
VTLNELVAANGGSVLIQLHSCPRFSPRWEAERGITDLKIRSVVKIWAVFTQDIWLEELDSAS